MCQCIELQYCMNSLYSSPLTALTTRTGCVLWNYSLLLQPQRYKVVKKPSNNNISNNISNANISSRYPSLISFIIDIFSSFLSISLYYHTLAKFMLFQVCIVVVLGFLFLRQYFCPTVLCSFYCFLFTCVLTSWF